MTFGNPMWLWGLGGIAIPLAIHLLSRKEGKVIRIGSLRHLSESTTQQFKSLRLNEVLLLLFRCALLALFVLLLAEPKIDSPGKEKWLLIEPGLLDNPQATALADSLYQKGYERKMFAPGFPAAPPPTQVFASYNTLLYQLAQQPVADAIVIASSQFDHFTGEQTARPTFVKWITIEPPPHSFVASARRVAPDTVELRNGFTDAKQTTFVTSSVFIPSSQGKLPPPDSLIIQPLDTVRISLVTDDGFSYEKKIIEAALKTLQRMGKVVIVLTESVDSTSDWLFWLSQKELPATEQRVLCFQSFPSSPLLRQIGSARWALTQRLTQELAVQQRLGVELGQLLLSDYTTVVDNRVMPEKMTWSDGDETDVNMSRQASIQEWLMLAFCLTLLGERLISLRKKL